MRRKAERPEQHVIQAKAENIFEGFLTKWIPRERKPDYRVDYVVEISIDGQITGDEFGVQLKGRNSAKPSKGFIHCRVEVDHLDYWINRYRPPLFLVVIDVTKHVGYWLFVQEYADAGRLPRDWKDSKRVTLSIPVDQTFDDLSRLRAVVGNAVRFMSLRNPVAIEDAIEHDTQRYERLDPRFKVSLNVTNGVRNYKVEPREPVELTVTFKGHRGTVHKLWNDIVRRGLPTSITPDTVQIKGSPLVEHLFSQALTIHGQRRIEASLRFSARTRKGKEIARVDPLRVVIEGGTTEWRLNMAVPDVPLKLDQVLRANGRAKAHISLWLLRWVGQPLLQLSHFDQIYKLVSALISGRDLHFQYLMQGNPLISNTIPSSTFVAWKSQAQFLTLLAKMRSLAERYGVNPIFPNSLTEKQLEEADEACTFLLSDRHPQPGNGRWIASTVSTSLVQAAIDSGSEEIVVQQLFVNFPNCSSFDLLGAKIVSGPIGVHISEAVSATPLEEIKRRIAASTDDLVPIEWKLSPDSTYWYGPPPQPTN